MLFFFFFCSSYLKRLEQDEAEPEHDALQVPEDPAWLGALANSPSRIVTLPLKIAYNGFPLKFSRKEGWKYVDDKGEVDKLRAGCGRKTSQILGPRHAKALLASGEMISDDNEATALLSQQT